ncbi:MAG: precorrin-6y C5,15-methyltransferase (decarboxylating) subunit CbiE [Acidimicrobiales bacterium]
MSTRLSVVGMVGGEVFGRRARRALEEAEVLVGAPRHLTYVDAGDRRLIELRGPLDVIVDRVAAELASGLQVAVLASGDPGFFGIVRLLHRHVAGDPRVRLEIHPAPSSVSLAWAAAGEPWDDADVVSAHGRRLDAAVEQVMRSPKVAVLTSPESPPQRLGSALLASGCPPRRVVVASQLGEPEERLERTDLEGLAGGVFDPLSVVLLIADPDADGTGAAVPRSDAPRLSWGSTVDRFEHRDGMITKPEVRAVVLSKLTLGGASVLWDIGAGSGSVGIEAATIRPDLVVHAVERHAADVERIRRNATAFGVADRVCVHHGEAPEILSTLPTPDRVFVGGGGPEVLDAAWALLPSAAVLVATFTVLEHAVRASTRLGELLQIHVDRAVPVGGAGLRLEPANPVFIGRGCR